MITAILKFFAKRTHNVQAQVLLATFYGLVSLFGVRGTIPIIMKMRKKAIQTQSKIRHQVKP